MIKQIAEIITEEKRQVVLNTCGGNTLGNVGIDAAGFRVLLEEIKPAGLKGAYRRGVQRKLARG